MRLLLILLFCCPLTACAMGRTVKGSVKDLQTLKTECDNLQIELDSLGAKKWTKVIDNKVKACKDHGFWPKKQRRPIKTFLDD